MVTGAFLKNSWPETELAETGGAPEIISGSTDELETRLVSVFIPFAFHHVRSPSPYSTWELKGGYESCLYKTNIQPLNLGSHSV